MRNASGGFWCSTVAVLQQVLVPQAAPHGLAGLQLMHRLGGDGAMPPVRATPPPLLFRALASLNLLLLVAYLLLVLLAKLFARLHLRATAEEDRRTSCSGWYHGCDDHRAEEAAAAADIVEGQRADTLFWFDEAVFEDTALLLGDEGKDHLYATPAERCLQQAEESTFPVEEESAAPRISPGNQDHRVGAESAEPKQQVQEEARGVAVDVPTVVTEQRNNAPPVTSPENNVSIQGKKKSSSREEDARRDLGDDEDGRGERAAEEGHAAKTISGGQHDVKLFVNSRALADTRKVLLDGVAAGGGGGAAAQLQVQDDKADRNADSSRFGASTLASESTSKSSVEWRSSTVTKDSETEYPFSSSSRRSSARWESYTLFRKYDEDMVYFHRVGAQKLTETESFRSIKYQPRSMSERLVQKLTPKPSAPIGLRDPYPDLERAYVAQVCLTWEALNWSYTSFRRHNGGDGNIAARCCPARVAQEFQQFQVLLHRFIENEPYEYGRRPEVYARMKNSTPKLLLVPEFRDEEDEKDDLISAVQFLLILEESIRTFMAFLRADKRSHYEMFREMVKRRSSGVDQTLVITLKKANKRKKSRLKDLTRPRRCLKRTKLREEEELSILLGLIDLKVVARVLHMPEVTDQQLHWCEEKMNRVRVDLEGRMQRDPSPLFYPAH
ncbi:uncharacterized protein LOC120706115 [Panicum virgatum]|uniref:Transmembrane protein n=1 Tax=Panicum virgatum TaxID=38727 RepID=A0A8T0SFQ0_PANVG|nr:uncharacterized protein LOC120706115 [Panicum virgatum]KAG2595905.1 hypothetical protein PVAP13_5KG117100 [Panicum virgatum]